MPACCITGGCGWGKLDWVMGWKIGRKGGGVAGGKAENRRHRVILLPAC